MARGRPRKPVEIHRFQGTYRKDRHGDMREFTEEELPYLGDPLEHLTDRQKKIWQELRLAAVPGVLRVSDTFLVEITVCLLDEYRHDPEFKTTRLNQLIKCLTQMGFSMADRIKMDITPKEKDPNPFDEFESL